jgi:hypothetical protein
VSLSPTRHTDVCLFLSGMLLPCVVTGLETGRYPVHGTLPNVCKQGCEARNLGILDPHWSLISEKKVLFAWKTEHSGNINFFVKEEQRTCFSGRILNNKSLSFPCEIS